jgi:hypothetical protein
MAKRSCPFCGKPVDERLNRCPYCREAISPVPSVTPVPRGGGSMQGRMHIRRGLLWALLAGVIYYFASGDSGLKLPVDVPPFVNEYLTPLLFLAGAGMALYGWFLRWRS